jgi:polysaccharide biosynthesis protein PslL
VQPKTTWIDCWKGIGILAIVVGHIVTPVSRYLFWFHIPLFFFISGYLYKAKPGYMSFLKKKSSHLLIPYLSFAILLLVLKYIYHASQLLLAPKSLVTVGWFSAFWFVLCLFITQQLYGILWIKFGERKWIMLGLMTGSYCLAMLDFYLLKDFKFPQSIDTVTMALPFYWLGHMASEHPTKNTKLIKLLVIVILLTAIGINYCGLVDLRFDMKYKNYGFPVFNVLIALAGIYSTQYLAKFIDRKEYISGVVREFGSASMIIMYLHQPIQLTLKQNLIFDNQLIRVIAGLIIPYFFYKLILNFSMMRKLFLGDFQRNPAISR